MNRDLITCCRCGKRGFKDNAHLMTHDEKRSYSCCEECYQVWHRDFLPRVDTGKTWDKSWDRLFEEFLGKNKEVVTFT